MTLFRQLFIGVSFGFLLLLAGIELVYINSAKVYLQDQLSSHSQDAATSISIAVAPSLADGDLVRAETIVGAVFDRGYYQYIRILNPRGDTVILKTLSSAPPQLPSWFTSNMELEVPVAESMISKEWRQLGRVIVSSHPHFAYLQLWHTTVGVSAWLAGVYVATLVLLYIFLKNILNPLEEIERVAHAISNRDFKLVNARPRARELSAVVSAINDLSGNIRSVIEVEISAASRFRAEAYTDELTRLENRRSFTHQLQAILDNPLDINSGVLYLVQVANFQVFNSSRGFQEGDALLMQMGNTLAHIREPHNMIRSRLNGATFAIAAFNLSREEADRLGNEICTQSNLAIGSIKNGQPVYVGCGGVYFENAAGTFSSLMANADMALLQALSQSEAKPVLLVQPATEILESKGSLHWKQFIQDRLSNNRIALLAQPVIAFKDSARLQYEVVGRLIDDAGELVPAAEFMPMAIRHGLIAAVDMKLIEKIFQVMGENGELDGQIAINLSAQSIHDPELTDWLRSYLSRHPGIAHRTVFEFSEFAVVQDRDTLGKFVTSIRSLGANFAVDKFGLHHAAFEYLQALRPAYIKISPMFISDLPNNPSNQFFITSVVKITNPLGIKIFAHSIESNLALEVLKSLEVDGYQGFATGQPMRIT